MRAKSFKSPFGGNCNIGIDERRELVVPFALPRETRLSDYHRHLLNVHAAAIARSRTYLDLMRATGIKKSTARKLWTAARHARATEPVPSPLPVEELTPRIEDADDGTRTVTAAYHIEQEIHTPEELVAVAGIDLDAWEIYDSKVNTWATAMKDAAGEPVVKRLWQVQVRIRPRLLPFVRLDWPAPPVFVAPESVRASGLRRAIILPDMQIGGEWRDLTKTPWLDPSHDRAAIDLALQVVALSEPTDIVLLGDNLDLPSLSRWPTTDGQRQTTLLAMMEYRWLLHRLCGIAPNARIVYCEGIHELRLSLFIEQNAGEIGGLVPSLPTYLGLDALGIEYVPYRDEAWLWNDPSTPHLAWQVQHGEVVKSRGGATSAAILTSATHSSMWGHTHRREIASRRLTSPMGAYDIFGMSPGCLCRKGSMVPGGKPRVDWQQGVGEIVRAPGCTDYAHNVAIDDGRAVWRGEVLTGRDYSAELAEATGATAFVEPVAVRMAA